MDEETIWWIVIAVVLVICGVFALLLLDSFNTLLDPATTTTEVAGNYLRSGLHFVSI